MVERLDAPEGTSGMPYNAMSINFLIDLIEARVKWVDDTIDALKSLSDTADSAENRRLGERHYERALQRLNTIVSAHN